MDATISSNKKEEGKKEYLASSVLARLPSSPAGYPRPRPQPIFLPRRPRVPRGRDRSRFFSRVRRRSVSPREETDRGDVGCKCKLAFAVGAAHEERDNEQDKREVVYSLRAEEAQSRVPTGKRSHKERLTMAEIRLDVLEASLEELYQGQRRLLGVESWQEETES
ncbi:hypothetical protein B296_00031269 [Ensete ventricosum]|uniref:Uncharacterized protein n=1 Tax=Ensete ventricosum TaxID=4639 RepID=A0A426Z197_ENSVE|nr:hypothetical protein B296_00031269 [Ensete ventricosum]